MPTISRISWILFGVLMPNILFSQDVAKKFPITIGYGPSMALPHHDLTHNVFVEFPVATFSTAGLASEFAYFSGTGLELTHFNNPSQRVYNSTDIDLVLAGLKARFQLFSNRVISLNTYLGLSARYGNLTNTFLFPLSSDLTGVTISSKRQVLGTARTFQIDLAVTTGKLDLHVRPFMYFLNPSNRNVGMYLAITI